MASTISGMLGFFFLLHKQYDQLPYSLHALSVDVATSDDSNFDEK